MSDQIRVERLEHLRRSRLPRRAARCVRSDDSARAEDHECRRRRALDAAEPTFTGSNWVAVGLAKLTCKTFCAIQKLSVRFSFESADHVSQLPKMLWTW